MAANFSKQTTAVGDELLQKHPCLYAKAPAKYRIIHLPVSPVCNIQCRFCKLNKQDLFLIAFSVKLVPIAFLK